MRGQPLSLLLRRINSPSSSSTFEDSLLLKGIHPGVSDLWVWKSNGFAEHRSIRVEKLRPDELKKGLRESLSQLEECEVLISGIGVTLRGKVYSIQESGKIHALVQTFPQEIHDETELTPSLLDEGEARLKKGLSTPDSHSQLRVARRNGALFVTGSIEQSMDQEPLRKKILALFPAAQIQISTLPDQSPTVYFRVFLLELKKTHSRSLGLNWPPFQEGAFRITPSGIENLLQLDLTLEQLEGEGSLKILSNPELAVRAPGEAELFSGGELPIQTHTPHQSNIHWKNFGLTLKLKVTHSTHDQIRLEILTEVSTLDPSMISGKVPGIQANRMKTQVDARYGTPLLLSGLLQQGTRQQARGLPVLRKIPILGALLGSEDYLNDRSELVAILLPLSAPPAAPMDPVSLPELPRGRPPFPRQWISPQEEKELKNSSHYPWNILDL